jgi:hypothetical protein
LRFDLDQYLAGRGKEMEQETPLDRSENRVYLDYRKGSLAFYRLRAELGEAAINRALKTFLEQHLYKTAPYATTGDLLDCLRAEAPADKQALITDLFQNIVLYDNRIMESSAHQRPDGRWDVTLKTHLAKLQADGKGRETPLSFDEAVDLAIYAKPGDKAGERVLYREKRALPGGDSAVTITVNEKPSEVSIDPDQLLIQRNAGDSRKAITVL